MKASQVFFLVLVIGTVAAALTYSQWESDPSSSFDEEGSAEAGSAQSRFVHPDGSSSRPVRLHGHASSDETDPEGTPPSEVEEDRPEEDSEGGGLEVGITPDWKTEYSRSVLQRWTRAGAKERRSILEEIASLDDADLATALLNEILTSSNPSQKKTALRDLLDLAPEMAADAASLLLQDSDRSVQRSAVKTLGSAGDGSHVQPLMQANQDWCGSTAFDTVLCARTLDRLGQTSAASQLAERQARDYASGEDQDRLESMKRATYDGDLNLCVSGMGDVATGVRLQALSCLVQIGGPPELEVLEQLGETKGADLLRSNLAHGEAPSWWVDIHGFE